MYAPRLSIAVTIALASLAVAQAPPAAQPATSTSSAAPAIPTDQLRSTYLLGPDDEITIHAVDAEEISDKPIRIDSNGYIRLALAGRIKASGLTVEQLEAAIVTGLKPYIIDPQVSVSITEFHSQPVSVLGSVRTPGVLQLQGHKTLIEIISLAGGLTEDAGHNLEITRRLEWGRIPLPSAVDDPTGHYSIAHVNLQEILGAVNPAQNIQILPEDVISVPRARMVYVIGQVSRPGGYILGEQETFSVLKALSLAGGTISPALTEHCRILRPVKGDAPRQEIPIDVKAILAGKSGDVPLQAEDILFVPVNGPRKALTRAAEAVLQIGTGVAIYGVSR